MGAALPKPGGLPAPPAALGQPAAPAASSDDVSVSRIRIDDLPAPKRELDLPAPRDSDDLIDLPAPRAGDTFSGENDFGLIDLPQAKQPTAPKGETDLPRVKGLAPAADEVDLPRPKQDGGVDLPQRKDAVDLPKPKQAVGGWGEADLPTPKTILDGPGAVGGGDELGFGDLDLPGLSDDGGVDLPAPKGVDLPAPKTLADLPAPRGQANLPRAKGPSPTGASELPAPPLTDESDFGDIELPDLPALGGPATDESDFSDIDLPPPRPAAGVIPPKEPTVQGFGGMRRRPGLDDGDSELPPSLMGGDDEFDMSSVAPALGGAAPRPRSAGAGRGVGGGLNDGIDELGELDLDDDVFDEAPQQRAPVQPNQELEDDFDAEGYDDDDDDDDANEREFGFEDEEEDEEGAESGFSLPPDILRRRRGEEFEAKEAQRKRRALTLLVRLVVFLVVVGAAGAGASLTEHGVFGVYYFEQFLPEAGDPQFARAAIDKAEKVAMSDTYGDVRRSLNELGQARGAKGLNRLLLTRSLVHEALYIVRFGDDPVSASRIAAILRRLEARSLKAPGIELALAADAARRKAWDEVGGHLDAALQAAPDDPYAHLLAGETAMAKGKLDGADKAFAAALKNGGGARAQWGLARVATARGDLAAKKAAVSETLKLSPAHADARTAEAGILWQQGKEDQAMHALKVVIGLETTEEDKYLWSAKAARAGAYGLLGYIHEARGRSHLARQAYDQALAADPFLVEALLGSGRVLLHERRHNDALARFESALGTASKGTNPVVLSGRKADVEAQLGIARSLMHLERGPDAKARLTKLTTELPNDSEIVLALGETEQRLDNAEAAETHFRRSVELAPDKFDGYLALAQLYFEQDRADQASKVLNEAAARVEETSQMRRMLGESELRRNHIESAIHEYERALDLDPHDMHAMFGLASALRKNGQLPRAQKLLETIAARDAAFAGLARERGLLFEARGDFASAVAAYQDALSRDETNMQLVLRLGAAQLSAGELDAADQTLARVIREQPNSAEAEYFIGRVAFARGRTPDALTSFGRAVSLDGTKAEYHLYAGRAALALANLARTSEEIEAALKFDPSLGDAYWVRAVVKQRTGRVLDALKDVDRALQLNPARTEAYAVRGECYDQLGQLPKAIEAFRTALERQPDNGEWWYKLGRLHLHRGSAAESTKALERAKELGDKLDPLPYWLPDAYRMAAENAESANNRRNAIVLYKRYLEIARETDVVDRRAVEQLLKEWGVELGEEEPF